MKRVVGMGGVGGVVRRHVRPIKFGFLFFLTNWDVIVELSLLVGIGVIC